MCSAFINSLQVHRHSSVIGGGKIEKSNNKSFSKIFSLPSYTGPLLIYVIIIYVMYYMVIIYVVGYGQLYYIVLWDGKIYADKPSEFGVLVPHQILI